MSQVSATTAGHPASWSLGPSLTSALHRHQIRHHGTLHACPSPLPVHRHSTLRPCFTPVLRHGTSILTFTTPSTTASELHTCTPQAKRSRYPARRQGLVNTTPKTPRVSQSLITRARTPRPWFRNLPLDECIANTSPHTFRCIIGVERKIR